jgi:hypothetical protein
MTTVIDFTQLVILLAWLAGPMGMMAWMMAWTNWLRNVRTGDPASLSPLEVGFREWLETGWRKSPLFIQVLHAFVAAFVPALAFVIITFVPEETLLLMQPYYAFLALVFLSYIGSQAWYQLTKTNAHPVAVQNVFNEASSKTGESVTNATTLNIGGASAPPPAQIDAPNGPGALSPGVDVQPRLGVDFGWLQTLSDNEIAKIDTVIQEVRRSRGTLLAG